MIIMNNEWEKFGKDIRSIVEDAVNAQDFRQLNRTITDSINEAVNSIQEGLKTAGETMNQAFTQPFQGQKGKQPSGFFQGDGNREYSSQPFQGQGNKPFSQPFPEWGQQDGQEGTCQKSQPGGISPVKEARKPELFKKNTSVKVGGTALAACGYTFSIGFGAAVITLGLVGLLLGHFNIGIKIALSILCPLLIGSGFMAWKGSSMLSSLKRYRGYIAGLHGRTYCNIKELADKSGKPFQYVLKDVRKMIEKGWFRQGHLDQENTCLIVSHDTYQEYQAINQQREQQRQIEMEQKKRQESQQRPENGSRNPEVQKVMEEGTKYLNRIQACNAAIPEQEISQKISHMEMLVQKIFDRVEEDPDSLEDIEKLMEYYLPTTVKLLDAYQQLGSQPIQGENIRNSKEEIEKTLDTLNVAFEKLLDSLFEDVAWDVSSDISVLHTMLAQEGLTKDDFKK